MQFPNDFIQASTCLINSKTFTEVTSYGFNDVVAKRGNPHKWIIDFTTRKLNHIKARQLQAFLDSLDGRYTIFTLPCPLPFLGGDNNFSVASNANAGDNSISVNNLPNSITDILVAGDFINFSNHDKTYKIVENADSNGSGNATMKIYPRLQSNIIAGNSITEGVFTLRMRKDEVGLNLSGSNAHNLIKVSAMEA